MRGSQRYRHIVPVTLAFLALTELGVRAQCAMCRTLLMSPDGQRLAAALRAGIMILLAAPFATFGVIAYAAVRSQQRVEARRRNAPDYSPALGKNTPLGDLNQP